MRWDKRKLSLMAGAVVVCSAPALGGPVFDVEVRLVPTIAPAESNELAATDSYFSSRWDAELERYVEPVAWPPDQNYSVEVWASDNNSASTPNTGVIAAYFDISWDNGNITHATGLTHELGLFGLLPEGTIDNSHVINFGGSDGSFVGQGLEPTFARVGAIELVLTGEGLVLFDGLIGEGEVGVRNRTVGDVLIVGGAVPEPGSLVLFALGTLVCLRRR